MLESTQSILIVEDENSLGETLQEYLRSKNYQCDWAKNQKEAQELFSNKKDQITVVIMDIGLPDGNGLSLAKEFRDQKPQMVLLFLSALNDPTTRLQGLEIGALDYITKPFELKELTLRLERILGTQKNLNNTPQVITHGPLKIFFSQYRITDAHGTDIELSQKECSILKLLYENQSQVLSRDKIIDEIWGKNSFPSNRTVDNYIVKLRKWTESDSKKHIEINTVRGIGYKLNIKE